MNIYKIVGLFCLILYPLFASAQLISVGEIKEKGQLDLSYDLLVLRDSSAIVPIDQVLAGKIDLLFTDNYTLRKGIEKNTQIYWGKLTVQNSNSEPMNYLIKMPTYLPKITVFIKEDKAVIDTLVTGNNVERKQRSSKYAGHIPGTVDFRLPPKTSYTLYFKFELDWNHYQPKKLTVHLYDQESQNIIYSNRKLLFGLVFGVILVMLIYNLAFFVAVRDYGYLYYVLYIGITGLFSINYTNYTFHYFWPSLPEWHRLSFVHLGMGSIATFLLFSKKFIRLKSELPQLNKAINFGMLLLLTPIILVWSGHIVYADIIMAVSASISFLVVLYFSILIIIKSNNRAAYFLLVGFIALIICFVIFLVYFFGPLNGDFELYSYLPQAGVVFQIVIFGIGLSDRVYQLQMQNNDLLEAKQEQLEIEVSARTAEVTQQKEEILTQRDDIKQKNERLETMLSQLRKTQSNVQSSLNYAKRIQDAFLPQHQEIAAAVSDFFILSKPRDIVSGDFYWFKEISDNKFVFAVADCTGHGVPGAFMSMIGEGLLDKIIVGEKITTPSLILNRLHTEIIKVLNQDATNNRDGMDINICLVDKGKNELQFAGARNQMMLIQNDEFKILKGDRKSIGGYSKINTEFTNHTVLLSDETQCYLASDGYRDQIGGPQERKIYQKNIDKLLKETYKQSMQDQKVALTEYLENWMGTENEQLDDILVIGLRI